MEMTLKAVDEINLPAVIFWPNSDAGTNEIAKTIRVFREQRRLRNKNLRFVTDLAPEDFIALLRRSSVLVGNSSAGIKESSYLGVPVVNIGSRQANRLRGSNVVDVGYHSAEIKRAVQKQLAHGLYPKSELYYRKNTSKQIVQVLSKAKLYTQKKFYER